MRQRMSNWPPDHVFAWFADNETLILLGVLALILLTGRGLVALKGKG